LLTLGCEKALGGCGNGFSAWSRSAWDSCLNAERGNTPPFGQVSVVYWREILVYSRGVVQAEQRAPTAPLLHGNHLVATCPTRGLL
jgi:hypothetical protein